MKKVLILGIGNTLHRDDGIGVHIVNRMQDDGIALPENVEVMDGGTAGFDLIPLMQGKDRIVIVDALKSDDEPGSVYRFDAGHLRVKKSVFSLHETGIAEVLKTLRLMGDNPEVEIVGIVPSDITTMDIGISDSVARSVPKAIEIILQAASE
jgi:hydrogenase maturation protease